ncbi:NifB/NifX family molybdenum-iron cluster-binding protein [Bacteroidota bacterium]
MKKIAIPVKGENLSTHFGHADHYMIYDIEDGKMINQLSLIPPPHAPGVIPKWLSEIKVNIIIAGGIGQKAVDIFNANGIEVISGVQLLDPLHLINSYLIGNLVSGMNLCDH